MRRDKSSEIIKHWDRFYLQENSRKRLVGKDLVFRKKELGGEATCLSWGFYCCEETMATRTLIKEDI